MSKSRAQTSERRRKIYNNKEVPKQATTLNFYNGCRYKVQFHSERMAQRAADYRMSVEPDRTIRFYKCSICRLLHLTSQPENK